MGYRELIRRAIRFTLVGMVVLLGSNSAKLFAQDCSSLPGGTSAQAINNCLMNGGTVGLQDGGVYSIDQTLNITVNGTILTGQGGANRPVLRAAPGLSGYILQEFQVDSFQLRYLKFDGNSSARPACAAATRNISWNVYLLEGSNWIVDSVESSNAVCGSGMTVAGAGFTISNSLFQNNGTFTSYSDPNQPWADGLTVLNCNFHGAGGGSIHDNTFLDNTDIGLIVGGGRNCNVYGNTIDNQYKHAFAGLSVGFFPEVSDGGSGDHTGSTFHDNHIAQNTITDQMAFGLEIGNEPWWNPTALDGFVSNAGSVTNNTILGAVVNLAIDGMGAGTVTDNQLGGSNGTDGFYCTGGISVQNYTAHFVDFSRSTIQPNWYLEWFFGGTCGTWQWNLPQPGDPGAIVHDGDSTNPADDFPRRRKLLPGDVVWAGNGAYYLAYQASDGNLVMYAASGGLAPNGNFQVPNHIPGCAMMQADGNFVVYSSYPAGVSHCGDPLYAIWSTGTSQGYPPASGFYAVVQGDGNFVIYDLSGVPRYQRF